MCLFEELKMVNSLYCTVLHPHHLSLAGQSARAHHTPLRFGPLSNSIAVILIVAPVQRLTALFVRSVYYIFVGVVDHRKGWVILGYTGFWKKIDVVKYLDGN